MADIDPKPPTPRARHGHAAALRDMVRALRAERLAMRFEPRLHVRPISGAGHRSGSGTSAGSGDLLEDPGVRALAKRRRWVSGVGGALTVGMVGSGASRAHRRELAIGLGRQPDRREQEICGLDHGFRVDLLVNALLVTRPTPAGQLISTRPGALETTDEDLRWWRAWRQACPIVSLPIGPMYVVTRYGWRDIAADRSVTVSRHRSRAAADATATTEQAPTAAPTEPATPMESVATAEPAEPAGPPAPTERPAGTPSRATAEPIDDTDPTGGAAPTVG